MLFITSLLPKTNMSFKQLLTTISENDTVILYLTVKEIYSVKATGKIQNKHGQPIDNVFQTAYGALKCQQLIGKPYGSKVELSKGWGYVLQPTPELWTLTLPHRTQIIYTPDISMILLQLELAPGSVVVESGTGSGSLSHALIRSVKPHGHLYTFDFHEQRAETARDEFVEHGLEEWVTVRHQDVCSDGFGEELSGKADAVFLDLPHPWLAIPHALNSLKTSGGRLCSFSPCIEQTQRACIALAELGFNEIQTIELLQTQYTVQHRPLSVINLDFLQTKRGEEDNNDVTEGKNEIEKIVTSVPRNPQPGHTGYLTFATLPPVWARMVVNDKSACSNSDEVK